jgi:transcriptional regulator of acetoin/glycerol metabolism
MKLSDIQAIAARICIEHALAVCHGNVAAAARVIGVKRTTFYKICTRHRIEIRKRSHEVTHAG